MFFVLFWMSDRRHLGSIIKQDNELINFCTQNTLTHDDRPSHTPPPQLENDQKPFLK